MSNSKQERRQSTWELIGLTALAVLLVSLFFSHNYGDLLVTTRQGINFWNILFDGQLHYFFSENVTESGNIFYTNVTACLYNILIYVVFAIWNIPLAILWKITSIDVMNNVFCLAWAKLLPVAAALVSVKIVYLILKDAGIGEERKRFAVYMFFSSPILIAGVFINCQYDTIGLIFQLLGLRCYLNRNSKGFLVFFGIALCFKLFAVIVFFPLLLLKEKKVLRLIGNMLLVLIPYLLTTVPFEIINFIQGLGVENNLVSDLFPMLFEGVSENDPFHWFIVVYGALLLWCYLQNEEKIKYEQVIWACFSAMCSFFVFLHTYPYWTVLMVPYIALLLATMPNKLISVMTLLEMAGSCSLLIKLMCYFEWTYWGDTMKTMALRYFLPVRVEVFPAESALYTFIYGMDGKYIVALKSCVVLAFVAMAILSYPKEKKYVRDELILDKEIINLRFAAVSIVTLLPIISLFI